MSPSVDVSNIDGGAVAAQSRKLPPARSTDSLVTLLPGPVLGGLSKLQFESVSSQQLKPPHDSEFLISDSCLSKDIYAPSQSAVQWN